MKASKHFSLDQIAKAVGGTLHGSSTLSVSRLRPLEDAEEGDLSFFAPNSQKVQQTLRERAKSSRATALLVARLEEDFQTAQIVVPHPMAAMIQLAVTFFDTTPKPAPGIHPSAVVAKSAKLAASVSVGAYAVIGEHVEIAERSIIYPHVVIYDEAKIGCDCVLHAGAIVRERTVLGDDCLVQNGAVLGSDGFGYIPDKQLGHRRIPHVGSLHLGTRVDVGTNTAIDRATLGESRIGIATKIDNLVQIGHNAKIGQRVLICGQTGIAGSCELGNDVILGGAVGVCDHAVIGPGTRASARTGITGSVDGGDISGYPHRPLHDWRRESVSLRRLPQILAEFRSMQRELAELRTLVGSQKNLKDKE